MSRLIDVSLPISPDMLTWPGDPAVEVIPRKEMVRGDASNVSELRIGTHTGTHVDPPVHFVPRGPGIDGVPVDALVGPAVVAHLPEANDPLPPADLEALDLPHGTERLLLRTANSELWRHDRVEFPGTYACLSLEAAEWVVERGLRLIGVDFLSVEKQGSLGHPVHRILLENDVVIVEGLNLSDVEAGEYTLLCLPLRIRDGDGGPARVLLMAEELTTARTPPRGGARPR